VAWAAVLCAAAVAAVAACSSATTHAPGAGTAAPASPTVPASSAAPTPTTSAPLPTSSAAPPTTVALVPQRSPDVAARSLFDAWTKGDRAGALQVATAAAVGALFARPVVAYSDRGCQDPISDRAMCAFGIGDGLAQVGTVSLAGGWVVESVTLE